MLAQLQQRLNHIYQTGAAYDVRDFLITDVATAERLGKSSMLPGTEETLLLAEQGGELAVSLYLSAELLTRLEARDPMARLEAGALADLWKVVEGISHFNYVAWKASQDREVSLFELELQAEIDKFVSTAQLASEQGDADLARNLHRWLFDDVRFCAGLDARQEDRYRSANDYAARFCRGLGVAVAARDDDVLAELRRFYRLPMTDKISHIHSRAW
jgi:hypothetical protein